MNRPFLGINFYDDICHRPLFVFHSLPLMIEEPSLWQNTSILLSLPGHSAPSTLSPYDPCSRSQLGLLPIRQQAHLSWLAAIHVSNASRSTPGWSVHCLAALKWF